MAFDNCACKRTRIGDMKICCVCEREKPLGEFHRNKANRDGRTTKCAECARVYYRNFYATKTKVALERAQRWRENNPDAWRNSHLKSRYGITLEDYNRLLDGQQKCCAICGTNDELVIDHDHVTGRVRGLLCQLCNRALGGFRDNPEFLLRAAKYVETN